MGAEVFASPITILFTFVVVVGASSVHYLNANRAPVVSPPRLALAYVAVVLCCAAIVAVSGYVSPEEALSKWHVPAESYWEVQIRSYLVDFILMSCLSLVGVALVGLPLVFMLGRRGLATVPYVLGTSIVVSAAVACVFAYGDNNPSRNLAFHLRYLTGLHLLLALSFCLAAGLPWKRARVSRET